MEDLQLGNCWAKTDEQGVPALSVLDHCLDVGAVSVEVHSTLLGKLETTLRQLADLAQSWWAWSDEVHCEVFIPNAGWLKSVEERRG